MKEILKFIYRFLSRTLCFVCILLPLQVFSALILSFVIPINGAKPLPKILKWFDNADQYVGRDTSTYMAVRNSGIWNNYCWLAWRNPLNYFGYQVLGYQVGYGPVQIMHTPQGSENTTDKGKEGFFYTEVTEEHYPGIHYEYYWIKKYQWFNGETRCFRLRIGHKMGIVQDGDFCQFVFVISPFHSFIEKT